MWPGLLPHEGHPDRRRLPLRNLARRVTVRSKTSFTATGIMGKLEGKIALVTGGNSGIGLATAKQFVNEGAYVFITGRREPELAAAVKEIGTNGTAVPRDVAKPGDLDRRIRVNAVSPGATDTPGLNELLGSSETGQQRLKMISNTVPLGRLGTPDEIAKAVVFLASDDSSYITGAELFVDGGFAQV